MALITYSFVGEPKMPKEMNKKLPPLRHLATVFVKINTYQRTNSHIHKHTHKHP